MTEKQQEKLKEFEESLRLAYVNLGTIRLATNSAEDVAPFIDQLFDTVNKMQDDWATVWQPSTQVPFTG